MGCVGHSLELWRNVGDAPEVCGVFQYQGVCESTLEILGACQVFVEMLR